MLFRDKQYFTTNSNDEPGFSVFHVGDDANLNFKPQKFQGR